MTECRYCADTLTNIIWRDERCRVAHAADQPFLGWCQVIWNRHVTELTDLEPADRAHFMRVVFAVETGLRKELKPFKINIASLGTGLPHAHWHIVPRFPDDTHFPEPVWANARRQPSERKLPAEFRQNMILSLNQELGEGRQV